MAIGRAVGQEPRGAAINELFPFDLRRRLDLALETKLGIGGGEADARTGLAQGRRDFFGIRADGRDDSDPMTKLRLITRLRSIL